MEIEMDLMGIGVFLSEIAASGANIFFA